MDVTRLEVQSSPILRDHVRLAARVTYDDEHPDDCLWYDVPGDCAPDLAETGNPWFTALLPLAAHLGQPLRTSQPVDPGLIENARGLMQVWKSWYPEMHEVSLEAEPTGFTPGTPASGTGALFSGGIDSFFTLLHRERLAESGPESPIDDLMLVWGFDIPLEQQDDFERLRARLEIAAGQLGKRLIPISTNLRQTRLRDSDWVHLWHGSALASVGLALEKRFGQVVIPSSHCYSALEPWGSHPLTDPLHSTSRTVVVHDGTCFGRVGKSELVATSEIALATLKVCPISRTADNCSSCNKCYRTLATFDVLGVLDHCRTFDVQGYTPDALARVYSDSTNAVGFFQEVRDFAAGRGRVDIADAIDRGLRRSRAVYPLDRSIRWLNRQPYVWRLARPLRQRLLRGYVT